MSIELIAGAGAPCELLHFAAGVATRFARSGTTAIVRATSRFDLPLDDSIAVDRSTSSESSASVTIRRPDRDPVSLELVHGSVRVLGRPEVLIPIGFDPAVSFAGLEAFPRSDSRACPPRLLFWGGGERDRRVRMTLRIFRELVARRQPFAAIAIGELDARASRALPGERHVDLTAAEWARLVRRSSVIIEATDVHIPPTCAIAAAIAAAVPTVTFRTTVDAASSAALVIADSWSADAFCDAILDAAARELEPSSAPFDRAMAVLREVADAV